MFALVGLMTDFFLQMFYFVPVLSVDIRRMEVCNEIDLIYFVSQSQHYVNHDIAVVSMNWLT